LKERAAGWTAYYLLPTGQWQGWDMFAPDPLHDTLTLEAVARDRYGILHRFAFPTLADRSRWEALWGFRHPKYAAALNSELAAMPREYAARYVLRRLDLPASAYPVDVELFFNDWPNGPGVEGAEGPRLPRHLTIQAYRFPSIEETQP
jgi:hypothetical protein